MKLFSFMVFVTSFLAISANNDSIFLNKTDFLDFINNTKQIDHLHLFDNIDFGYEKATNHLTSVLFKHAPPFDLSQIESVSPTCRKQSKLYIEDLKNAKLWALKMYDSSAKIPSGILNGNVNQLGDFDLCLQANENALNIMGQYCLASIQIEVGTSGPYISALHKLIYSHYHFKSEIDDPGHRVPKYSSINWALCIPNGCSPKDIELGLENKLNSVINSTGLKMQIRVDPQLCQSSQNEIPTSTIIASFLFLGLIVFELAATLYDYYITEKNEWITAFSLRKNLNYVCSLKRSTDDIEAIHGIRCLNAIMLLLSHKAMGVLFLPYVNRTQMIEFIAQPWSVLCRTASLYTDPFIMISGTLTTYSFLGKLQKNGKINIFEEYASRLLRIIPPFAALVVFWTFILPWINSGPMWNVLITHQSNMCKQYWWRNFLFIHNYFGFEKMCLTDTHHVGIDTQLFFISPFLILMLWKWPKKGSYILIFLALVSTIMRYYVTYTMKLSNYFHFGTTVKQLFETADNMYIIPAHRATVYIIGIFLGYILKNCRNFSLSNGQLHMGNALALIGFFVSLLGPSFMNNMLYVYNPTNAAWYAAFAPILWCFSFGWIIFNAFTGSKGVFERFFSSKIFLFCTKISYCFYLVQFPVFLFNVGIARAPEHFELFSKMVNLKEYFSIVFLALVMTVLFEMPFQNVRNLIFKKQKCDKICEKKIT